MVDLEDPNTTEDSRRLLEAACLEFLEPSSEDHFTLVVRRGITHDGYELLLRDRLLAVKPSLVESAIRNGTISKLAESYVDRLRSRLFTGQEPVVAKFRVLDVERERLAALQGVLRDAWGDEWLRGFIAQKLASIELLGASWAKPMKPITKLRLLAEDCSEEILARLK